MRTRALAASGAPHREILCSTRPRNQLLSVHEEIFQNTEFITSGHYASPHLLHDRFGNCFQRGLLLDHSGEQQSQKPERVRDLGQSFTKFIFFQQGFLLAHYPQSNRRAALARSSPGRALWLPHRLSKRKRGAMIQMHRRPEERDNLADKLKHLKSKWTRNTMIPLQPQMSIYRKSSARH